MQRIVISFILILIAGCSKDIIKYHGDKYHKVTIGSQTWMKENLSTAAYRSGRKITLVQDTDIWPELNTPAYGYYGNDTAMLNKYGMLYNYYAVNAGRLCPLGWRIPTNEDWDILEDQLGGFRFAGGRMKSVNGWEGKHVSGDDAGFNALPGGYRLNEDFQEGESGIWWSTTVASENRFEKYESGNAYVELMKGELFIFGRRIDYGRTDLSTTLNRPNNGFSVRCVKSAR